MPILYLLYVTIKIGDMDKLYSGNNVSIIALYFCGLFFGCVGIVWLVD